MPERKDGETDPTGTDVSRTVGNQTGNTGPRGTVPVDADADANASDQAEVDNSPSANTEEEPPIGTVEDAITRDYTEAAPKEDANTEHQAKQKRALLGSVPNEEKEEPAPITSVAQLRDFHVARGTAPTTEEVNKVRELERDIEKEGGKLFRKPAAERGA